MTGSGLIIWSTQKNQEFLLETGFINSDIIEIVNRLTEHDYSAGPEPDNSQIRPVGEVWKFYREHAGYQLYVKLKLQNGAPVAECMSCHEAEGEMRQPNRRRRP